MKKTGLKKALWVFIFLLAVVAISLYWFKFRHLEQGPSLKTLLKVEERCGKKICPKGEVCCNSSCGICTKPGGTCIQLFCPEGSK